MTSHVTFLDCTLRDGGYYNNWNFPRLTVQRYINATARAGVDVLELGFRTLGPEAFMGLCAHTTDASLRRLELPSNADVAVMVNVSDLVSHEEGIRKGVSRLFQSAAESPVDLVRLAAHMRHVEQLPKVIDTLADLEYQVAVNLMQISRYNAERVTQAAKAIAATGSVKVLYFADSFGDMTAEHVRERIEQVQIGWGGPIGFHAHDNRRLGLNNVITAVENGVTWIDGTIRGMGRGAGNAATEFILKEFQRRNIANYDVNALVDIVMHDFKDLHNEHGWGSDILYAMAAEHNVHPTYVQTMTSESRYDLPDIIRAIPALGRSQGHSYSANRVTEVLAESGQQATGRWDATNFTGGRDVLILGAGPQLAVHATAVEEWITDHETIVICLNTTPAIDPSMIDIYAACHPTRIALEADRMDRLDSPVLAPASMLEDVGLTCAEIELLDYGISVKEGDFVSGSNGCIVPARLAFTYAVAAATAGGARRILLAGLDGYEAGDPRQEEMIEVLECYRDASDIELIALTPTTYPVTQSSIYAPSPEV